VNLPPNALPRWGRVGVGLAGIPRYPNVNTTGVKAKNLHPVFITDHHPDKP